MEKKIMADERAAAEEAGVVTREAQNSAAKALYNDLAVDIAGVGFKTEPTTPHQIGGVRLSKTKGAHKSQAMIFDNHPLG